MERFCYTFELASGMEDEYLRRHVAVWPELLAALKQAGFSNYSLFRRGTEVIAYAECEPTIEEALSKLEATEINAQWSTYIRSLMTRSVDANGRLFIAEQFWHLD